MARLGFNAMLFFNRRIDNAVSQNLASPSTEDKKEQSKGKGRRSGLGAHPNGFIAPVIAQRGQGTESTKYARATEV